ncbi:MAG: hypothetical protein WCO57_13985 [Verrucomicrobiota bacterium]
MSELNQAQADSTDLPTVADPLSDAANSTPSGTNPIAAYEAELAAALQAGAVTEEQAVEAAAEETTPDTANAEVAEEAGESTEELSEEEEQVAAKAKDRFRFKDAADQAVAAIAKAKGISLVEAARLYEGEIPTKREDATTPQAEEVQGEKETVASVTATIEELRAQKREAQTNLEFETASELDAQIDLLRDKRDDLKIAEVREKSRSEQREVVAFNDAYDASERKAVTFYPDTLDPKSALVKRMAELDAQAERLGDPLFHSPEKPWLLTTQAALELGVLMTDPDQKKPVAKAAARPMQPASGNARTTATVPAVKQEEAIDKIKSLADYEKFVASLT